MWFLFFLFKKKKRTNDFYFYVLFFKRKERKVSLCIGIFFWGGGRVCGVGGTLIIFQPDWLRYETDFVEDIGDVNVDNPLPQRGRSLSSLRGTRPLSLSTVCVISATKKGGTKVGVDSGFSTIISAPGRAASSLLFSLCLRFCSTLMSVFFLLLFVFAVVLWVCLEKDIKPFFLKVFSVWKVFPHHHHYNSNYLTIAFLSRDNHKAHKLLKDIVSSH